MGLIKISYGDFIPIIKNTSANIIIRGLFGIARVFLFLLIARKFGPEDFGRLSLVISIVEIFRVLADFGVDTVTIRRFSLNSSFSERLLGNALSLKLLSATVGYMLVNLVFWFFYHNVEGSKLLFIVGTSLYSTLLANAFVSYFQANLRMPSIVVGSVVSTVFYILLTLFGLYRNWSLAELTVIIPLSELLNLFIVAKICNNIIPIKLRFDPIIILKLIRESFPVGIAGIVVIVYSRMDNLMLGWFLGEGGVGRYAVAYRLTEPFFLIFSSLSISLYAYLSGPNRSQDLSKSRETMVRIGTMVIISSICAAVVLCLFSREILGLISHKYINSAGILMILSLSIIFKALNAQFTAFINSRGKYKYITVIAVFNLLINMVLNLILIPRYGLIGAAIALTGTEAVNTVLQLKSVLYLSRIPFTSCMADGCKQ